jgi:DNA (cytosine-5)-methyltransferase 1
MNYAVNDNGPIRYATTCSGIEGVSVAWEPLGSFKPVFFSEVKPFPKAVLAHHWPEVPDLGDMTKIDGAQWQGEVDVLWGSTPCQSFSKAGKQAALKDERGQLTLKFVELANTINPKIIAWENVRNVIAANDNAFGQLLGALAGEQKPLVPPRCRWENAGYVVGPRRVVAWRCFDAQYSGMAARRERVFIVAAPVGGADPRNVLFERAAGARYPQPRPSPEMGRNPFTAGPTSVDGPHFFNADTSPKWFDNRAHTLRADTGSGGFSAIAVRTPDRVHTFGLTPRMRERLLGFDPDHTLIPWSGRANLDVQRRAALGNSVAIPDVRWIGQRIKAALEGKLALHDWPDMPRDIQMGRACSYRLRPIYEFRLAA